MALINNTHINGAEIVDLGEFMKIKPRKTSDATLDRVLKFVHRDNRQIVWDIDPQMTTGPWIAGGAVLNWHNNKPSLTDIDVWFKSEKQLKRTLEELMHLGYTKTYDTENAITLTCGDDTPSITPITSWATGGAATQLKSGATSYKVHAKIQLIKKNFYKKPEDIFADFDFTVCQLVTDGTSVIAGEHTFKDIKDKRLRITHVNPDNFLGRWVKYTTYGYNLEPGVLTELLASHGSEFNYDYNGKTTQY